MDHTTVGSLRVKYEALKSVLDERARRLWAATEAAALGRGGISRVAEATGMTHVTIRAGLRQLREPTATPDPPGSAQRVRRPGGGRKPLTHHDPGLLAALEALVEPLTRGDPQSPLRWTCKSAAKLAVELSRQGHTASPRSVNTLLGQLGYSLQSNRKTREGNDHPDRNAQFEHINRRVKSYQRRGQPVVSVDAKKKELVGTSRTAAVSGSPRAAL